MPYSLFRAGLILGAALACAAQDKPGDLAGNGGLPLRPERRIEFTTDEATWQSVDVSPDGKTILFDLLGDIYQVPIAGGEAKLLLGGMAFESQPKYSPDGKSIAFLSDRDGAENVWIANADGSNPRRLSRDSQGIFCSPTWTPDGRNVIATRGSRTVPFMLWMYGVDGGTGKQVPTGRSGGVPQAPVHNALGAAPSPDGRYIYYAQHLGRVAGSNPQFPLWQIARFDRATGIETILTREHGSAIRPVISPDGKKLVYGTRHDSQTGLRILDLVTEEDQWLAFPVQHDDQESLLYSSMDLLPGYAFTPDGNSLIASWNGKIHRIDVATGKSRVIPFTAKVSQDIGPSLDFPERVEDGPVAARLIEAPVESPDGKHLAFSALAHIFVMDLPKGTPRRLTSSDVGEFQPAWAPDSQSVAYVTWTDQGGSIWKASVNGGAPQRLTELAAYYRDPAWSPDGSRVVALKASTRIQRNAQRNLPQSQPPPDQTIVWIPAGGGVAHEIAPSDGLRHPQFSNDKERVYVHSGRELISMRFDGSDRRTELKVTAYGAGGRELGPADQIRVSPDGKWALVLFYMLYNQVYLVPIPPGGPGAPIDCTSPSGPAKKFAEMGADYVGWADGGATMTWAVGSAFFRQPAASIPGPVQRIDARVEAPRRKAHGTVVLRGAKVVTMRGDEVIAEADIVITDNRISAVRRTGTPAPPGATILDVRGKTIVPGFIDTHDHWHHIQRDVLELRTWDFLATLAYGVTSGRDPQTETNDTFAYEDLIDAGQMLGPRAFNTGPGIFWSTNLQSPEQALNIVGKYRNFYRTKVMKSYLIGNRRQRQLLLEACKALHIMPTAEGQEDFKMSLTHIIDGFSGNEHLLPPTPLSRDVIELIARSVVFYTPTLLVTSNGYEAENYFYTHTEVHDDPKARRFIPHNILDGMSTRRGWAKDSEYNFPKVAASLTQLVRAGGKVCVGSHGQFPGLAFHWEMWAMGSGGMTPLEVLRSATLYGAQAIGYGQDLGSIEEGKLADLVVLDKDPLQDIHNTATIRYVVKNGEVFEGATLDQVWPETRPLPPLWWWTDEPK